MTVGPGAFNRNVVPGAGAGVGVSGSGAIAMGVALTPGVRLFSAIDGIQEVAEGQVGFSGDSIVTNELVMCAWRLRCVGASQIYCSEIWRMGEAAAVGQWRTNDAPSGCVYDAEGWYEVGLTGSGMGAGSSVEHDIWDGRVFAWWLTDAEVQRVHANGVEEIGRRGIARWRE